MKKGMLAIVAVSLLLSLNLVSAYYFPSMRFVSQDLVYTATDAAEPILTALFGPWSSVYVFETLLLFLIILSLVYLALGKIDLIKDQKGVRGILTVVVPLLAVRFLDYEWLVTLFNTYKLLGIVLAAVVPFLLYFYFLYNAAGDYGIIRKLGWALWAAVYIGLWSSEYSNEYTSMVYFWTFIVGIVCLFGDNTINRRLRYLEHMKNDQHFKRRQIGNIGMEIKEIDKQVAAGALDPKTGKEARKRLEAQIKELSKM